MHPDWHYWLTDISTPHHINLCNQNLSIMKYGVNRVTLVGNVGEVPRVSEKDGEAFVANFPLATNQFYKNKEGEEISKTEWHHSVVNVVT
jgi:hypothetical protein